jgi:multicomponent Na+:H+ antiporter subunit E
MTFLRGFVYAYHFVIELIKANFQIVKLVFSPKLNFKSAAIKYKANVKTDAELILLTNSITLTPGTLVMDANLPKGEILVHVMTAESTDQIKKDLHQSLERRVLWTTRGPES